MRRRQVGAMLLVSGLVALALSLAPGGAPARADSEEDAASASAEVVEVAMTEAFPFRFVPETITVAVGTTVRWTTSGVAPHTVTSEGCMAAEYGPCSFDSGAETERWLREGTPVTSFAVTFTEPGVYPYLCRLHGQPGGVGQVGTVIVQEPGQAAPQPRASQPVSVAAQVEILSPREGEVIVGDRVLVELRVTGATVRPSVAGTIDPAYGHYHLLLDTTHPLTEEFPPRRPGLFHVASDSFTLEEVAPGEHTLMVVWGFDNHNPPQPPITATVRFFTVAAAPTPAAGPAGTVAQPPAQRPAAVR